MRENVRAGLDRDVVVRAALDLLDEVGLDALSTRRLADRLGVRSPALYWHFRDKQELLDLMAQELLRPGEAHPERTSGAGWAQDLESTARERRARLLSRRDGARLVAGTRPGPDAARAGEHAVSELVGAGMEPVTALHTLIAVDHFVTGFVLEEQAAAARTDLPVGGPGDGEYPLLQAAIRDGGPPEGDRSFEHGLTALIDGLTRQVPGPDRGELP